MAKARVSTLKLRPSRRKKTEATGRILRPVADGGVPLEDILVALEKSLARAAQYSFETSRAEIGFGLGERALYLVDALNITLKVGLAAAEGADGKLSHVLVDLRPQLAPEACSSIDFRIQAKPLEALKGAQLVLADLDALGRLRPRYCFRGTLLVEPSSQSEPSSESLPERKLHPGAGREVEVRIIGGDTQQVDRFQVTTNAVGQFEFAIDASENILEQANRRAQLEQVDLKQKDDDFFVFAVFTGPTADETRTIVSNIMHLDVKRAAQSDRTERGGR